MCTATPTASVARLFSSLQAKVEDKTAHFGLTMLLRHQYLILYPLCEYVVKMGDHSLSREKKMHDVSEPYLM